jgi:hypothetical protein
MMSPESAERPMVIGSRPRGSSVPCFGPETMTRRDVLSTVARAGVPLEPLGAGRRPHRLRWRGRRAVGRLRLRLPGARTEEVGAEGVDDAEDERPEQEQEADAEDQQGQFAHAPSPHESLKDDTS